jgi:hypothetical protein
MLSFGAWEVGISHAGILIQGSLGKLKWVCESENWLLCFESYPKKVDEMFGFLFNSSFFVLLFYLFPISIYSFGLLQKDIQNLALSSY